MVLPERTAGPESRPESLGLGLEIRVVAVSDEGGRLVLEAELSMEVIRTRLGHPVHHEAAGPPILGRDSRARDVDLLDVEFREVLIEVAEEGIRDVDAVVEVGVVLTAASRVDADVRVGNRNAAVDDPRSEQKRAAERALERKLLE